MYREKIVNVQTGEETYRDYTKDEIAQVEKSKIEMEIWSKNELAKRQARKSALAKLASLGLTEEEISAL